MKHEGRKNTEIPSQFLDIFKKILDQTPPQEPIQEEPISDTNPRYINVHAYLGFDTLNLEKIVAEYGNQDTKFVNIDTLALACDLPAICGALLETYGITPSTEYTKALNRYNEYYTNGFEYQLIDERDVHNLPADASTPLPTWLKTISELSVETAKLLQTNSKCFIFTKFPDYPRTSSQEAFYRYVLPTLINTIAYTYSENTIDPYLVIESHRPWRGSMMANPRVTIDISKEITENEASSLYLKQYGEQIPESDLNVLMLLTGGLPFYLREAFEMYSEGFQLSEISRVNMYLLAINLIKWPPRFQKFANCEPLKLPFLHIPFITHEIANIPQISYPEVPFGIPTEIAELPIFERGKDGYYIFAPYRKIALMHELFNPDQTFAEIHKSTQPEFENLLGIVDLLPLLTETIFLQNLLIHFHLDQESDLSKEMSSLYAILDTDISKKINSATKREELKKIQDKINETAVLLNTSQLIDITAQITGIDITYYRQQMVEVLTELHQQAGTKIKII